MRMKMKSYAAGGHNILTAADMKHALDAGSGIYMYDFCLSQLCIISMGHIAHLSTLDSENCKYISGFTILHGGHDLNKF